MKNFNVTYKLSIGNIDVEASSSEEAKRSLLDPDAVSSNDLIAGVVRNMTTSE